MAKKKKPEIEQDDFSFEDLSEPAEEEATLDDDEIVEEIVVEEEIASDLEDADALSDAAAAEALAEEEDAGATDVVDELLAEEDSPSLAAEETDTPDAATPGDEEDKDEADQEEEEEKPRARVTVLTMILAVLNILAACAFAFLLLMNYQQRHDWAYSSLIHDLGLVGLPLQEQFERTDEGTTADEALRAAIQLTPSQVSEAFKKRKPGINIPDKDFQDVNEVLKSNINWQKMSEEKRKKILKDMFQAVPGEPVETLEKEVTRIKGEFFSKLEEIAKKSAEDAGKKPAAEQRHQLKKILLPMAYIPEQIVEVAKQIDAPAADLAALRVDAVQRKICFDLLRIVQMYRHWDLAEPVLEVTVGPKAIDLKTLREKVEQRLDDLLQKKTQLNQAFTTEDMVRESYEKRAVIGFFLVAMGNLRVPPTGELLFPREVDQTSKKLKPARAEVVLGLVEYVKSANVLTGIVKKLHDITQEKITADRAHFVAEYPLMVQKLVEMVGDIEARKKQVKELEKAIEESKQILKDRDEDYNLYETKLLDAQKYTAEQVKHLKKLEAQLFGAQKELANIIEIIATLEQDITGAEIKLIGPKKTKGK